jgi:hypothetical protein
MKMKSKKEIREELGITKEGKLQINFHGAGQASVLQIRKNRVTREYNCKAAQLYK